MSKREEPFVLVPATFRERKTWSNPNTRTLEEIDAAKKAAEERKKLEEEQKRAAEAAEEEAFQSRKAAAESESANIRPRKDWQ
jgi:hypothetical protein